MQLKDGFDQQQNKGNTFLTKSATLENAMDMEHVGMSLFQVSVSKKCLRLPNPDCESAPGTRGGPDLGNPVQKKRGEWPENGTNDSGH